jgi:hypothetical protein
MDRFTKDDVLNELRTIFLFEADHILMGAGETMAVTFIGFAPGDEGEYCHNDPRRVDLGRFEIAGTFAQGYDFAFRPSVLLGWDGHEVQDLNTFMLATPRAGGIQSGGETHQFMTPEGYCQQVADAAMARWKLEHDPLGGESHTFNTRQLALLANMTEGAVRNALADKSENGLRAVPGSKPVSVEHAEALRWLSGRRGFIPSPQAAGQDRFLLDRLRELQTAKSLGWLITSCLFREGLAWRNQTPVPGPLVDHEDPWCKGTFQFDAEKASQIAVQLGVDVPLFVGKALEVSLRRDSASEGDAR